MFHRSLKIPFELYFSMVLRSYFLLRTRNDNLMTSLMAITEFYFNFLTDSISEVLYHKAINCLQFLGYFDQAVSQGKRSVSGKFETQGASNPCPNDNSHES